MTKNIWINFKPLFGGTPAWLSPSGEILVCLTEGNVFVVINLTHDTKTTPSQWDEWLSSPLRTSEHITPRYLFCHNLTGKTFPFAEIISAIIEKDLPK